MSYIILGRSHYILFSKHGKPFWKMILEAKISDHDFNEKLETHLFSITAFINKLNVGKHQYILYIPKNLKTNIDYNRFARYYGVRFVKIDKIYIVSRFLYEESILAARFKKSITINGKSIDRNKLIGVIEINNKGRK